MNMKKISSAVALLMSCAMLLPEGYADETSRPNGDVSVSENPASNRKGTVSLDFENADLKNVLKAFSMQTGINFIASDVIENKKITVFLSNVSIESALISILEANGLLYEKQAGNVYLIKPTGKGNIKTITKVFKLNYLQVYKMSEAMGATGTTSNITIIGQPAIAAAGSTSSEPANTPSEGEGQAGGAGQAKNIMDIVHSLMSKYGVIVADRRNNSMIVTDIPDVFESIEAVIKKLDVEPIQVTIQAEIVETTTSALKRIGMEYGSETQLAKVTYTGASSTQGGASSAQSPQIPVPFPFTQSYIKDTFNQTLAGSGLFKYGTLSIADIDIVLKLLAEDTDTKFLSRPNIMTLNNEPAVIKVSANEAIGSNNSSVAQTGQSISTAERAETGVILKVTPQVNDKGDIFMFIEPSVSRTVQSTLSTNFLNPSYRTSANTVMIHDMDTVVVAGLIQTNNSKTIRKIPFLGDIPILGEAFRSRFKKGEDTELLIFVTPHIVQHRDAEYVTPREASNRGYMIEKTLERYMEDAREKAEAGKDDGYRFATDAALKREDAIAKSLQKYSVIPVEPNRK